MDFWCQLDNCVICILNWLLHFCKYMYLQVMSTIYTCSQWTAHQSNLNSRFRTMPEFFQLWKYIFATLETKFDIINLVQKVVCIIFQAANACGKENSKHRKANKQLTKWNKQTKQIFNLCLCPEVQILVWKTNTSLCVRHTEIPI